MKILSWNCQGLGSDPAVRALLDVQKRHNPEVMFLSETRIDRYPADCLRRRLKMDFLIVNPSDGRKGGVVLLWKKEVKVSQLFSHTNYIDARVDDSRGTWRLTGMYGEFKWEEKYKTWDRLHQLKARHDLPWVVIGDFNEILFDHEKEGGNVRPQQYIAAFQQALNDCDLQDMGFIGEKFTWQRGQIRERLDRGVCNQRWSQMFPNAGLFNLEFSRSDHRPLLIDTEHHNSDSTGAPARIFFEARWLKEPEFGDKVQQAWADAAARTDGRMISKLSYMHAEFHDWDQRVLKKPKKRLRKAQRELDKVMSGAMNAESEAKRKELAQLVEYLLELEEIHQMQCSRVNWLHNGDRNTQFFHLFASARRKRNRITRLKNNQGQWVEGNNQLNTLIKSYFSDLFSSEVHGTDPGYWRKFTGE